MTWVRFEDDFSENPKIARLSDTALALWVTGIAYCNRNLTDGFIPNQVGLGQLRYCEGNAVSAIRELEVAGLWHDAPGGWEVHDFHDYQPSKAAVLAEREHKQAAGRAGGKATARARAVAGAAAGARAGAVAESKPVPVPVPKPNSESKPEAANAALSTTADIQNVYDFWRTERTRTSRRYDTISPNRRKKIEARLREFTADELKQAIAAVALDPWAERPSHDDLTIILRNREQVERFLGFADAPPSSRGLTARDLIAAAQTLEET